MALTLYAPVDTAVHRLHPVTKVCGLLTVIVAAFLVDRPAFLAPLLVTLLGLLIAVGGAENLRRFRIMFVLVFVFTLLIGAFFGGRGVGPDRVAVGGPTRAGFDLGLSTAVRLATFLAAGLVFLTTTRIEEVAYALGCVHVPYKVGFTLMLSFRLVPVFFDAALSVVQAQRCRGLPFDRGGPMTRLRRFVPVIVPVLIGALRRADRMAMALELRGFNSGRPRTTFLRARAHRRAAVAGAVAVCVLGVYVGLWLTGVGSVETQP